MSFAGRLGDPEPGAGIKNPFGGGVGRRFRSIGSRYVQWNPLDSSKTIEHLLLKKVAILLRIVAFLASSEKLVGSLKKVAISLKYVCLVCLSPAFLHVRSATKGWNIA